MNNANNRIIGRAEELEILQEGLYSRESEFIAIYALGRDGQCLSREPWKAKYADSEDMSQGNNMLDKVFLTPLEVIRAGDMNFTWSI